MPVFQKASKLIALSAFALSATFFAAPTMRAATTAADTAAAVSTSTDAAPTADATATPQAAAPAAAPAPAAPAAPPTWSVGPITFSGLVDGYYSFNANHPTTPGGDAPLGNEDRSFDTTSNGFALSMVKLSMAYAPAPVGFQVDMMFGPTADNNFPDNLEQAYVAWKPTKGKGFEADFGQFVTSAGAEVIESMNDTNYSRSLLFQYLIPLYHVGLRTSMPVTKKETVGFQLVNQFNGTLANDNNAGKTIGLTSLYTATNWNWAVNYYVGPENPGTDVGFTNLIDTTLNFTPAKMPKWTSYINYDYKQIRNALPNTVGTGYHATNLVHEQGIAAEARYQATGTIAFSGRYEYIADQSGLVSAGIDGNVVGAPGIPIPKAGVQEFTITGEYKMSQGLLARLEYRRDHSDNAIFTKGQASLATPNLVKSESTLEVGIVAFFGPAH